MSKSTSGGSSRMKKIMVALMGLSLLCGTAVFAQDTAGGTSTTSTDTNTMSGTGKKHHKHHKGTSTTGTDTSSTTSTSK
ncbi:MAG: hypothetical protein JO061_23650 [Acidobacteriaceae bacterium]|nr:hypothetical protein [Acidobacteriaceae bacterium]